MARLMLIVDHRVIPGTQSMMIKMRERATGHECDPIQSTLGMLLTN